MSPASGGRKGAQQQQAARPAAPDDDEIQIGLGDRVREAMHAAMRRKLLSFFMLIIGVAFTIVAVVYAPRTYECDAQILITRTTSLGGPNAAQLLTGDERKELAKEYEQQIMARDNIIQIVQQAKLVERWNEIQSPHRRLISNIQAKLGQPRPTDDQKFEALMRTIEGRLKVEVDATTVAFRLEWSEPKSAKDIVTVAVENFQKKRFEVEVGVIPESVRALQKQVDDKRKETQKIAKELNEAEAKKNPTGKTRFVSREVANNEPGQGDPAIFKKLEAVRGDIAQREELKRNRLAELNAKLADMSATYAAGHPDMIALKNTLAATQHDPAELAAARAEERRLAQEFENSKNAKLGEKKTVVVATTDSAAPAVPQVPLSVEGLRQAYERLEKQLTDLEADLNQQKVQEKRIELAFKNRYSVTRPPEVPGGPKKPVGPMAGVIGALCTFALMLVAAVLRDRASGLFYEPRDVRDRLGLPVYATMKW